jgi:hypothetical protein
VGVVTKRREKKKGKKKEFSFGSLFAAVMLLRRTSFCFSFDANWPCAPFDTRFDRFAFGAAAKTLLTAAAAAARDNNTVQRNLVVDVEKLMEETNQTLVFQFF